MKRATALVLLLTASACAHRPAPVAAPMLGLAAPAGAFDKPFWLSQAVTGGAAGRRYEARFEVQYDDKGLVMVAVTPAGLPLFTLRHDGAATVVDEKLSKGRGLDPAWILDDFLAAYLPASALGKQLAPIGGTVVDGPMTRRILAPDGGVLLEIGYQSATGCRGNVTLENRKRGYRLDIHLLEGECP